MIRRLLNWFQRRSEQQPEPMDLLRKSGTPTAPPRVAPRPPVAPPKPDTVELDVHVDGRIESNGPGKNVLIRNKYLREENGTHETLKILDDSAVESDEEAGIDPYNTGRFDRSKNWDKTFRRN